MSWSTVDAETRKWLNLLPTRWPCRIQKTVSLRRKNTDPSLETLPNPYIKHINGLEKISWCTRTNYFHYIFFRSKCLLESPWEKAVWVLPWTWSSSTWRTPATTRSCQRTGRTTNIFVIYFYFFTKGVSKCIIYFPIQGWGVGAGRSLVLLAPCNRSQKINRSRSRKKHVAPVPAPTR